MVETRLILVTSISQNLWSAAAPVPLSHVFGSDLNSFSFFSTRSRWCSTPVKGPRCWDSTASWKTPRCRWPRSESTRCPASPSTTRGPKQRCLVRSSSQPECPPPSPPPPPSFPWRCSLSSSVSVRLSLQIARQTSTTTLRRRRRATRRSRTAATTPFTDRCVWEEGLHRWVTHTTSSHFHLVKYHLDYFHWDWIRICLFSRSATPRGTKKYKCK